MKNRLLALLLVLAMVVSLVPAAVAAESTAVADDAVQTAVTGAADPITVTMSFVNGANYGLDKNGRDVCNVPVQVTDRNSDGKITMEEGFLALHEAYHTNGVSGYNGSSWITKFWSIDTSMVSYVHNNCWVYSPQEEIFDGDTMDLFIYQDQNSYSDLYTYFDGTELEAEAGTEASFKLNGYSVFGSGNIDGQMVHATAAPVGATISVYDENGSELTDLTATVGADGTFAVTFPKAGTYTIQAGGKCNYKCDAGYYAGSSYTNAPVVPTRATVTVTGKAVPTLKEGVEPIAYAQTVTGRNYDVEVLQKNQIFDAPEGETLNYTSYWYVRSTDGGQTWSETPVNFPPSEFGFTTIQFTENTPGTYMYKFRASTDGGKTLSDDTWTLVLTVSDESVWDVTFNVGRDMNYSSNGSKYPLLKVWKTAGITEDGFDYVGWYDKDGENVYVTVPSDYTIAQADGKWTITDADATYDLNGYEPVTFTNSAFGKTVEEGTEVHQSGDVVDNYAKYYASVVNGRYSFRAYGYNAETEAYDVNLGGMSITIPTDRNVDGGTGGGTELYLINLSVYSNTAKSADKSDYFDADSYYTDVVCPIMGCHATSGEPYVKSGYTYYPYMVYAAGNACLYNYYAYPKNDYPFAEGYENWMFGRSGNQTPRASYSASTSNVQMKPAARYEYTVPATAEFDLYYQDNNFNTRKVATLDGYPQVDGDTKTYAYMIHKDTDGNYSWRLTDTTGQYVTLAGWNYPATDLTKAFENAKTDKHYHQFDQLGTNTSLRDEADLMVGADPTGLKTVGEGEQARIRAYRLWQLINSDTANIMVEPDFHYTILSGKASKFESVDGGNASGNWIDVDPDGTVIAAVYYDAVDVNRGSYGSHGGYFPATNPERVGVYVVSDETAGTATASIPRNGTDVVSSRPEAWDYNFDTWYYAENDAAPVLNFTTSGASTVEYATVMTDSDMVSTLSDWTKLTAENGTYSVDLLAFRENETKGGTVLIRMTDASGNYSYQLVRVAQVKITASNATNPGEPIQPGNSVKLSFQGLYRGIHKVSGVFNPTTFYLRYTVGDTEVSSSLGQYQKMDRASITLTLPKDIEFPEGAGSVDYSFTNGYTFGQMYSAANPFAFLYTMTDTGMGTNFNAVTVKFGVSKYADAVVTVYKETFYKVNFQVTDESGAVSGYTLKLTDAEGNAVEPNADGTYALTYGAYSYELTEASHVRSTGSFRLGTGTENDNGNVTMTMTMEKTAANPWDGVTTTEPEQDDDGVYLISNAAELAWVSANVNSGAASKASFKLTADIELAGFDWTPIGVNATGKRFSGTFDGDGHKILNLCINYNQASAATPYQGLFGYVDAGTVKNLAVYGEVTLTSSRNVSTAYSAGIVAYANGSTLSNLTNYANVTVKRVSGTWKGVAGVVGWAYNSNIDHAANYGTITGYANVAGITAGQDNYSSVTDSINEGAISGYSNVAGISGYQTLASYVLRCVNTGAISGNTNVGGVSAQLDMGMDGKGPANVTSCYNTGDVTGQNLVGGILGTMNGDTTADGARDTFNGLVQSCYSTGKVIAASASAANLGGVSGRVRGRSQVLNSYFLDGTAEAGVGALVDVMDGYAAEAAAKTLAEMQAADFVDLLNGTDETKPFVLNQGGTPVLSWQKPAEPVSGTALTVESVTETQNAGDEVTVAVKVSGNTGFTNFELLVDYDHSKLELKRINTSYYYEPLDMEVSYLPGFISSTEVNKAYNDTTCGFITVASANAFTKDATLFTLTFQVKSSEGGEAYVRLINQKFNLVDADGKDNALNPVLNGGTILTAASRAKTYDVTFVGQDGQTLKTVTVEENGTVAASDIPAAPEVEGYTFTGWKSGETVYTAEQVAAQTVTAAVTYTAQYEVKTFDVTFTGKDGEALKTVSVNWNGKVAASDIPAAPEVEGYTFTGWKSGDVVYTAEQVAAQTVTAAVTYTAQYEVKTFDVTFTGQNGEALKTVTVNWNGKVAASDIPAAPEVEGYTFTGWKSGDVVYTAEQIAAQTVTAAVTYTAVYEAKTFDVTFADKDGQTLKTVTVAWNGTVAASDIPDAPVVSGYVFTGWKSGDVVYTAEKIASRQVTGAVTYTAVYAEADRSVTLTLDGETETNVFAEQVKYTVSAKNMSQLGTVTITLKLDEAYLTNPVAEGLNGWTVFAQTFENGELTVVAGRMTPADGDGELLSVTAKPAGQYGSTVVSVTAATLSRYDEDQGESFVKAILDGASVTTNVTYSKYDVNHDGIVDQLDVTRAQRWYGTDNADCDVNGDGVVDIADLILILNNYTK